MNVGRTARAGLFAGAVGAAVSAAAVGGARHWMLRRPLPKVEGRLDVEGLEGPVTVRRDRWGVPHVEVAIREDLWFAQGFVHAQDRLFQMDFFRRVAAGRLAEVAGSEGIASDRFLRTLGIRHTAEREATQLDAEVREKTERFCAGVNAGADSLRARPLEMRLLRLSFEPWSPADILSLGKLLAFGFSTNWERELLRADMVRELGPELTARLDPGYPVDNPIVSQRLWSGDGAALVGQVDAVREAIGMAPEASGSNNWAVAAGRSATGGPLVAGDMHVPPVMPSIWYQCGLRHGERFARGASMPGMPGIYVGQNNDVAWTATNAMADVQDLYVERVENGHYLFRNEWLPLETRREEIEVKGRDRPEMMEVRATHHGPLVSEFLGAQEGEPLALRWLTLDGPTTTAAHFGLLDVTSGPELSELAATLTTPCYNVVWADRHGSIGYKLVGRLPIRFGGCPDLPKPGWSGEFEWEGLVPYEEQPGTVDPQSGYLVTANNRISADEFPHHVTSDWLDGYRAKRIEQLIGKLDRHDVVDFERMQADVLSLPGLEVADRLSRLQPDGDREAAAIDRLRTWDGHMSPDSIAASIYQAFLLRLAREVARRAIGDEDLAERWLDRADNGFMSHVSSPWRWHSHLLKLWAEGDEELAGRPWDELALDALRGALDDLEEGFGADQSGWSWGKVHEMEFPNPLGGANRLLGRILNRRLRAGGAQETVSQIAFDPGDPYRAVWAPAWRMVADPLDPDRSRWQMFTGQSGHPGSPHYDDLQADWLEGRTQPMAGEGPWKELTLEPT